MPVIASDRAVGTGRSPMNWLTSPSHARWLEGETDRLLGFGRRSALSSGGFGRQTDSGDAQDGPVELWITCRMTHLYALGQLLGRPGCAGMVDHGIAALRDVFADRQYGGWFAQVSGPGEPDDTTKAAYPHAFVVLAASSATVAGRPGAPEVLADALSVQDQRFWDEDAGMVVEEWDREFHTLDGYRGVNANMHTVEAYLSAADVTGDRIWLDRAVRIVERVVHREAAARDWRIPEHYDASWNALPDYNSDLPDDPFRPFGATPGHSLEWARLTVHTRAALAARGDAPPDWMLHDAVLLFDAAVRDGWAVDGTDGIVYTVDWSGEPVVRQRFHWVVAEAIGAVVADPAATGQARFAQWYETFWEYAGRYLLDRERGSWWHELAPDNTVARTVWSGKPDLYHAAQATLIPRLPLAPMIAPAVAAGLLR